MKINNIGSFLYSSDDDMDIPDWAYSTYNEKEIDYAIMFIDVNGNGKWDFTWKVNIDWY